MPASCPAAEGEGSGEAGEGQGSEGGSPAGAGGISRTQVRGLAYAYLCSAQLACH